MCASGRASFLPSLPGQSPLTLPYQRAVSQHCPGELVGRGSAQKYLRRNDLPGGQNFISFFFCCLLSLRKPETPRRDCGVYREQLCCASLGGWSASSRPTLTLCVLRERLALFPFAAGLCLLVMLTHDRYRQPFHPCA